jgi:hypothetical protein
VNDKGKIPVGEMMAILLGTLALTGIAYQIGSSIANAHCSSRVLEARLHCEAQTGEDPGDAAGYLVSASGVL